MIEEKENVVFFPEICTPVYQVFEQGFEIGGQKLLPTPNFSLIHKKKQRNSKNLPLFSCRDTSE